MASVLTVLGRAPGGPEAPGAGSLDLSHPARRRSWPGRVAAYLVTVYLLVTLDFFLPKAMPGSPIQALVSDPHAQGFVSSPAIRAALSRYYGLNQPLWEQYLHYLSQLAHGNLGVSITTNTPVTTLLAQHVPWTVLLVATGFVLAALASMVGGIHSGWRRDRPVDRRLLGLFLILGYGPVILLAPILIFLLAVKLPIFPLGGGSTPFAGYSFPGQLADVARHLALPAVLVALNFAGPLYLLMRGGMVGELGAGYLQLGRAKGLRDRRLKYRYAARNALLPVLSDQAIQLGRAVGIAIVVERLFAYPGLGTLLFTSVGSRDYPTLQGCFLVIALGVVSLNLVADLAYGRLDPRTRS